MDLRDLHFLLGMACENFCLIAADMTNIQNVILLSTDEDKIYQITDNLLMGVIGDDSAQFSQYIAKNLQLYKIRNQYPLSTQAAVHFTRRTLAESLRTMSPFAVKLLIGGYDEGEGGQLYYLESVGASVQMAHATHGIGGSFADGILDSEYRYDLTEEEAYDITKLCAYVVQQKYLMNLSNFIVKIVSKDGIKTMPLITPDNSICCVM